MAGNVRDTDGSPTDINNVLEEMYESLESGGGGGNLTRRNAGVELAAAFRLSQFSWNSTVWESVEGLDITLDTAAYGGPAWITGTPGFVMANTLDPISLTYRLFNASRGEIMAHGFVQLAPQTPDGVSVGLLPPLTGRSMVIPQRERMIVQVKSSIAVTVASGPDWFEGPGGFISAIGA